MQSIIMKKPICGYGNAINFSMVWYQIGSFTTCYNLNYSQFNLKYMSDNYSESCLKVSYYKCFLFQLTANYHGLNFIRKRFVSSQKSVERFSTHHSTTRYCWSHGGGRWQWYTTWAKVISRWPNEHGMCWGNTFWASVQTNGLTMSRFHGSSTSIANVRRCTVLK